jgi:hypothetical protein
VCNVSLPTSNCGSAIDLHLLTLHSALRRPSSGRKAAGSPLAWETSWSLDRCLPYHPCAVCVCVRPDSTATILILCIVGEATVPQGHACGAPGSQREPHQRAQIHRQARVRGGQRGVQRVHHEGERVTSDSSYILILRRLRAVGCLQRDYKLGLLTRLLRGCKPQSW